MKTVLSIIALLVVASLVGCMFVPVAPAPPRYEYVYPRPYAVPHDGYYGDYGPYRHYGYRH